MKTLELHLRTNENNNTIKYKIGYFQANDFITIGKGASEDRDYILNKIKDTYGRVSILEDGIKSH